MKREELLGMTVVQLKGMAREAGHRGTAIDYYTKAQLVDLLANVEATTATTTEPPPPPPTTTAHLEFTTPIESAVKTELKIEEGDVLANLLANALKDKLHLETTVDETKVRTIVEDRIKESTKNIAGTITRFEKAVQLFDERVQLIQAAMPTTVNVVKLDGQKHEMGIQHKTFKRLLELASINLNEGVPHINIWLVGAAGTGKTTAAENVARALELPFHFNGAIDTEYKLRGFIDAQGKIVSTAFMRAYREGGVYLFDEVDSSLPPALLAFNAALANNHYDFPDGIAIRHPKFICIAAANTFGLGADTLYVGRMKQDAAFLDRFVHLEWPIDEGLERALAKNDDWVDFVQAIRRKTRDHGMQVVVSPRASMFGATLLAAGIPKDDVIRYTVRKSLSDDQWRRIAP